VVANACSCLTKDSGVQAAAGAENRLEMLSLPGVERNLCFILQAANCAAAARRAHFPRMGFSV